jgi:hypothetical protein
LHFLCAFLGGEGGEKREGKVSIALFSVSSPVFERDRQHYQSISASFSVSFILFNLDHFTSPSFLFLMGCGASTPAPQTSIVPAPAPAAAPAKPLDPKPSTTETPPAAEIPAASGDTSAPPSTTALIGVQKAAKAPAEDAKEKLEDRAAKRKEERSLMKQQMNKDKSRFKDGLPTSPVGNDARRAAEIASFEPSTLPAAATSSPDPSSDPIANESAVVSKEEGLNVTDYS